ncbi:hypothetical protein MMC14_009517 [Varicellaria rhodocarpa]|nr:hypothetical protein [Varicellaria rhodocarpa]
MSSGMMDTEAGGESTQYESIKTVTKPHSKAGGQMGSEETQPDVVDSQLSQEKNERGEKTAENIRYGESLSEHGFGGETTGKSGSANQEGHGSTDAQVGQDNLEQTRREQGYGSGSGVGA